MKKILFFLFAAVLAAGGVEAQEAADSMKIFYRRGYRNVDLSFRDNRAQMERFLNLTEAALKNDRVEKVVIRSYASPDGTAEANERLSVGRAEELKAYLVREGNIPASLIEYHAEGIAWGMLREQVAASDMAGRDEVLDILDHTPLWIYDDDNRIVDGRKKQLMDLQGGKPYNYMLEHFFPELRNSVSTVLYLHIVTQDSETEPEPIAVVPSEEERAPQQEPVRVPADAASMPCETTISATVPAKPRRSYPANMIGVHAGYCTSWITSYGLTSSTRPGYEVGVSDRIRLGRQFPFYLRTGLTFISKGYEVRGFDDSRTTMNYLQIPVGIDYTVALGERFALIPHAGFYYAVGVGGKRKVGAEEIPVFGEKGGFSRHDMGFSCGADITFGRFGIGVAYQIGLINIDKTDIRERQPDGRLQECQESQFHREGRCQFLIGEYYEKDNNLHDFGPAVAGFLYGV